MKLRPRRDLSGDIIDIPGEHLVIECRIFDPESWSNRHVYLWLDDTDCNDVMKMLRDHMIERRRQEMA
jgi:hypothetical protein